MVLIYFFSVQVGFLYLRYAAEPKTIWNWVEPYITDDEVIEALFLFSCRNFIVCWFGAALRYIMFDDLVAQRVK